MLSNVYLFSGEEKYLLDKEIFRRKENFQTKFGSDSVFSFTSENFDIGQIKQAIFAGGLFVSKKLILITGLPTDSDTTNKISAEITEKFTDEFISTEGVIPADSLLIFVSYKPDKRGRLYKFLEKNATTKTFEKLSGIELKNFVKNELNGVDIDYETIDYLLVKVGNDIYRIINECKKLKIWHDISASKIQNSKFKITNEILDFIVFGQTETNSFAFFDNFFDKAKSNLKIIDKIQEEGINRNQFIGTLYRGLRLYIYVLDLYDQGITDSKTITSITKQHPFAISKSIKNIKKIKDKEANIKKFYKDLIVLDNNIKSGKFPDSYFWLGIKKMIMKI